MEPEPIVIVLGRADWDRWKDLREASKRFQKEHVKGEFILEYPESWAESYRVWGAQVQDTVIGYAAFIREPKGSRAQWRFLDTFVQKDRRNKGIATALLKQALSALGIGKRGPLATNAPIQLPAQRVLAKVLDAKAILILRIGVATETWTLEDFLNSLKSKQFLK